MNNHSLLQLTLQEKIKSYNNPFYSVDSPEIVLPYAQQNDDKDNQIIDHAKTIAREWKQMFTDSYGNDYAFGLYRTYSEVINNESKLNKLTQDYIKQSFKDETYFKRYFMNHKNAPKLPLNDKF